MKNRNGETEVRKTPLLGPAICSLLLLLCIAFAVYKLYADNASVAAQSNPDAERQAAVNGQLREEKAWLEALGGKKPCDRKEELSRQGPQSIFGGGGAGTQNAATASPQSVASAPPQPEDSSPSTADSRASGPAETPAAVADLLEDATVFVLGQSDTGMSMGSGFFFASDLIFTNRHVVEQTPRNIIVINKKLRRAIPARIVAASGEQRRDYVVLQVQLPADVQIVPLRFAVGAKRTERVSAWGYPHAISKGDPKYQALISGMAEAAPELSYADGVISAVLDRKPPLIVHTAPLSPGNSGGPLANEKGFVVGVNSMISLDEDSYRQTSIALPASDILSFLKENSINVSVSK